tara:strand:+ start:918 stop:1082 length:165 start_codon:yes stop_codon:yes gene_type:complete
MFKILYIKGVRNPVTGVKKEQNFLGKEEVTSSNIVIGSLTIKELRITSDSFFYL